MLVTCRSGVPECRVVVMSRMTRSSRALLLMCAILISSVLPVPRAVLTIVLFVDPLIGIGLLASTDLLIRDCFLSIPLLAGIPLLGWMWM